MFRKILIAGIASLSLLSPLALPMTSQAHELHRHRCYDVMVRECCRDPWRCAGEYRCREDAIRAARHFRQRGFEAYVR